MYAPIEFHQRAKIQKSVNSPYQDWQWIDFESLLY